MKDIKVTRLILLMRSVYRLQYASNLNVNRLLLSQGKQLLKPVAPNLALLGDIGLPNCKKTSEFFAWCNDQYENVYWVPGFLEMADQEGKKTWIERIDECDESIRGLRNVRICLKYKTTIKEPHFQLLLSPIWQFTEDPIYTYTRYGPKQMTHEDFAVLRNSDMNWLLHSGARHSLPVAWMTYSQPFTGLFNYPKLLCSISGTSDYIKNTSRFRGQTMWTSINMGGYSGYLNDAVWEYSVEKEKEISLHDQITKTLLRP